MRKHFLLLIIVLCLVASLTACNFGGEATKGEDGHSPEITIQNGYWFIDGVSTGVVADASVANVVSIENGYWFINGTNTQIVARGTNGTNGTDGHTPVITINNDGYWCVDGVSTNVLARGTNGTNGKDGKDGTNGINGKDGKNGVDGHTPVITINNDGYWVIDGENTEVLARGTDGEDGESTVVSISNEGYWIINGEQTEIVATGSNGASIYELYVQQFGFEGTEEEWLEAVVNGTLGSATLRTVAFDYNGLEDGELPAYLAVKDGLCVTLPTPEREGYDFVGWFTGSGVNDGQWTNTLVVSKDLNLLARWQKQTVTVRYEDKNGVLLSEQAVDYGDDSVPPVAPAVASYVFSHWDNESTEHKQDVTIRPVYIAQRYTVTYDTDGGNEIDPESYLYTETPIKPLNPQKAGFVFAGWKNAETDEAYEFDAPLGGDTTLVAVWLDTISISTVEELLAMGDDLTANYTLANDINLQGAEWAPLGSYSGTFNGANHKIYNFKMTDARTILSFFETNNGTIQNVTFADVIVNQSAVGSKTAVVAATNNGNLNNVKVLDAIVNYSTTAKANNDMAGGIVAENAANGIISNSKYSGQFGLSNSWSSDSGSPTIYAGGIVANNKGVMSNIQNTVIASINIYTKNTDWYHDIKSYINFGGICGANTGICQYLNCDIQLTGVSEAVPYSSGYRTYLYEYYGGVIGTNSNTVTNCIVTGTMNFQAKGSSSNNGVINWGGVVGNLLGSINVAQSEVDITGTQANNNGAIGGIVGAADSGTSINNSWYSGDITSTKLNHVGGICGWNRSAINSAYMTGTVDATSTENGACGGLLVGLNLSQGVVNKVITDSGDYEGNGIGTNQGVVGRYYNATSSNKAEVYQESTLFENNTLDSDVWGLVEGDSVYIKEFH